MVSPAQTELELTTTSPGATLALAERLAAVAVSGDVICLRGELGAGKTVFAKGFATGLGVTATVNSPSFILMAEHQGRLPLFHLDLYRLPDATAAVESGLLDERQGSGVTIIEWAERLGGAVPEPRLDVRIDPDGDDRRRIALRAVGRSMARYLRAARS
jgi:tRNA threonylcarbamoyladenosine biosynthesis protein TsaE